MGDPSYWRDLAARSPFAVFTLANPSSIITGGSTTTATGGASFELRHRVDDTRFVIVRTFDRPGGDAAHAISGDGRDRELTELLIHHSTRRPTLQPPTSIDLAPVEEDVLIDGDAIRFDGIAIAEGGLKTLSAALTERTAVFLVVAGIDERLELDRAIGR